MKPIVCFVLVVFLVYFSVDQVTGCDHGHAHDHGHHHGHHHGHGNEHHHHGEQEMNPAFKYSRAANEKPVVQQHHGHSHDDHEEDHHDHRHEHHGHAHEHEHKHEHGHDHGHAHDNKKETHDHKRREVPSHKEEQQPVRDKFTVALHATLSTLLISIAPFIILFFIPLNNNSVENQSLLKVLLGFASGSLLGDAFLHLIPHALNPHDHNEDDSHSHSHSHDTEHHDHSAQAIVGLWVLAGIMVFLLVEKVVRNLNGGHSHTHSHEEAKSLNSGDESETEKKTKRKDATKKNDTKKDEKSSKKAKTEEKKDEIQVAGYLNLAADFSHNFTDGLAIGASFLAGHNVGLVTTLAILFHEVPHEIGDFAILIQSGCSKRKAIFLQLFTALGALSGTWLSLIFETAVSGFATSCILPFTAGGFIYIATVSIIPELKESTGLIQSIKEILALCAGVAMMVVIAIYE